MVIPTYNESENIERMLHRIHECLPEAGVLVVDDGSPDGTADIVKTVAAELPDVHLLSRNVKSGLGSAYRAGFAWGLERGFDAFVEIDADFSHDPAALPGVVGAARARASTCPSAPATSRAGPFPTGPGTATCSRGAATSTPRAVLGLGVADSTAGYRAYSARDLAPAGPGANPGRGLRLPDRDDVPGEAARRGDHRGADQLRRPGRRRIQDVLGHRRRGARPRHLVGLWAVWSAACAAAPVRRPGPGPGRGRRETVPVRWPARPTRYDGTESPVRCTMTATARCEEEEKWT